MKTIVNFFVVLLVLSILAGCTAFINEPKTAAAPGMARVSLNTGSNSGARTITGDLVPLADAMQYDNTYTAVFKESGGQVYTFDFTSIDSTRIFDVPAGAYDILVLAGYIPSTSTSKYLLGSGYVQNKELVVGENPVTITLFSIDAAFFLPPSVPSGGNLEGTLQVDLRNPLLTIGAVGGSFEANSFTSTPNGSGAYTLSATAPTSPTNINEDAALTIGFAGANNLPLPSGWCISDNNISSNDDYTKRFIKTITVGPYTITGIVTASDTGNPIAGATVELYNNAPALIDSKTTDADGRYVFGNVSDNFSGSVEVSKSSYLSPTPIAGVTTGNNQVSWSGGSLNGDFVLNPAAQSATGISWGND